MDDTVRLEVANGSALSYGFRGTCPACHGDTRHWRLELRNR